MNLFKNIGHYSFGLFTQNEVFYFDLPILKNNKVKNKKAFCLFTSEDKSLSFMKSLESRMVGQNSCAKTTDGLTIEIPRQVRFAKPCGSDFFLTQVSKIETDFKKIVLINPSFDLIEDFFILKYEDHIYSTHLDHFTGHLMTSNPKLAKALLALRPEDLESFGMNISFHVISNAEAPESFPDRHLWLEEKVRDIQQLISRLYIPSVSGKANVICLILNLDNSIEEKFFIRKYATLSPHIKTLFLTSDLHIYNDQLKLIPYNGMDIGGILIPLMDWYFAPQNKNTIEENQISF